MHDSVIYNAESRPHTFLLPFSAGAVFFGEADFFFAKRLFSSGGGDVSGERRLTTMAESGDK